MAARQHRILWVAALLIAVAAVSVHAAGTGTVSAQMAVSAVVVANCRVSLTPLEFGTYDPLATNNTASADTSATVLVTCTRNSQVTIDFDQGQYAPVGSASRMLAFGAERLVYQIYRDTARTQTWGKGADGVQFAAKGISSTEQFTVYGRIPPGQEVPAGTYSDLVTATVDF
jgi:spore coat protein U-like protein